VKKQTQTGRMGSLSGAAKMPKPRFGMTQDHIAATMIPASDTKSACITAALMAGKADTHDPDRQPNGERK
jgi:hypothetical protein